MSKIFISDVTLREGSDRVDISLSFKEKIEIAKLLDKLGVDVIEVSPIKDEKTDTLFLRTISPLLKNSILSCPVGLSKDSADKAFAAVCSAIKPRLVVSLPVSAVQMEYLCHKKPAKMLELISALTAHCVSLCPDVEFAALDATRCEESFLVSAINAAVEAGAKTVTICDQSGTMLPDEFSNLLSKLYDDVPGLKSVVLSVECSNELDMANACVFAAVKAGALQIKTCTSGRNLPGLESLINAMRVKGDYLGVTTNVNSMTIKHISSQLLRLTDTHKKELSPFDNELGSSAQSKVLLDETSDISKVGKAVSSLGYDLSEDDLAKVYESFRTVADKKQVGAKELDTIVANVAHQVPPTYRIVHYVINAGNVIQSTANIVLEKNGRELKSVCMGDGPIDAAFLTIEQIIGHHYELDDFQIQSVTEGREAMGDALVKLRSNGKLYSGKGVSTDIIGASIIAYVNALNKIVYEENSI